MARKSGKTEDGRSAFSAVSADPVWRSRRKLLCGAARYGKLGGSPGLFKMGDSK